MNPSTTPLPRLSDATTDATSGLSKQDLDILRGWSERHDPHLRSDHLLPPLARLVCVNDEGTRPLVLHGPQVVIGRYHPQHGPVDLVPWWWSEPQLYKLGSPHIKLSLTARGWRLRIISPSHESGLSGHSGLLSLDEEHPLAPGDLIKLGVMSLRFEVEQTKAKRWDHLSADILRTANEPTLFLKRHGGLCGPSFNLTPRRHVMLGRGLPQRLAHADVDWDLAGLFDDERRHLGFRHASLDWTKEGWELAPTSVRQKVWLNREELREPALLRSGDEVGLGNVLLHFHDPGTEALSPELPVPALVDWFGEHSSDAISEE